MCVGDLPTYPDPPNGGERVGLGGKYTEPCFASATLSGSGTKAAPPVIAQGAIGTADEQVQRPERAAAPPDDLVSCCAREMVAGAGFSPARARWMFRRSERASADEPSRLHPLRPPAARRGVPATSTTPLDAGPLKRSGLRNGCRTASSGGFRGRARVRFWHAVGREDPVGRLRCEFEVGLSPKYARAGGRTKTAFKVKPRPVQVAARFSFGSQQLSTAHAYDASACKLAAATGTSTCYDARTGHHETQAPTS